MLAACPTLIKGEPPPDWAANDSWTATPAMPLRLRSSGTDGVVVSCHPTGSFRGLGAADLRRTQLLLYHHSSLKTLFLKTQRLAHNEELPHISITHSSDLSTQPPSGVTGSVSSLAVLSQSRLSAQGVRGSAAPYS